MVGVSKGPDSVRLTGGPDDAVRPMTFFSSMLSRCLCQPKESDNKNVNSMFNSNLQYTYISVVNDQL